MFLRYLVLFGGIVLMITGCNSLISQHFGTHRLRTLSLEAATAGGIGDADFVELTEALLADTFAIGAATRSGKVDYFYRPILSPAQADAWRAGRTVSVRFLGWRKVFGAAEARPPDLLPPDRTVIRGLVSEPRPELNPTEAWPGRRIELDADPVYLELGERPLAWYWNLALFLGGLLLAILPEARRFGRERRGAAAGAGEG